MSENVIFKIKYIDTRERNIMPYLDYLKLGGKDGIQNKQKDIGGYINYMADRDGSEHILRTENGLDVNNIVHDLKKHEGIVWLPIISLKEKDSIKYGCATNDDWNDCVNAYVDEFCKAYNLARDNVEYIYCKHEKSVITSEEAQKQPHVHLCIFQKQELCNKATISKERLYRLHDKTDKIFMKEHYKELYEKRNSLATHLKSAFLDVKDSDISTLQEIKMLVFDITKGVGRSSYNHFEKLATTLKTIQEKQTHNEELNAYENSILHKHEIANVEKVLHDLDHVMLLVDDYVNEILNKPEIKTIYKEWEEISTIIKDSRMNYNTKESFEKDKYNLQVILKNLVLKTDLDKLQSKIQIEKEAINIFSTTVKIENQYDSEISELVSALSSVALALHLSYSDTLCRITNLLDGSDMTLDMNDIKNSIQNVYKGNRSYINKEAFTKAVRLLKNDNEYPYRVSKPYLVTTYKKIFSVIPRSVLDKNQSKVTINDFKCELKKEVEVVHSSRFK